MKKIILSIALVATTFAFAQKKEILAAAKAIEAGDTASANSQISAAESAMGGKTHLLEPSVLEQYYYAKGLSLLKSGKNAEGAVFLAKMADLGKNKIYTGKDSEKNKVYYVGKSEADKSGIQGLKEESYSPTLTGKLGSTINPLLDAASKAGSDAFNNKNYAVAGPKFKEVYDLLKATGTDNKMYLYYAAVAYSNLDDKTQGIELYNQLIDGGYTGIETTYTAKNKKSGEPENLSKSTWELYKKMGEAGDYTDFKTETSPSVEKDLYVANVSNLYNAKRYDEAIKLADAGLKKFPNNKEIMNVKGLSFYNSGKSAEFIETLKSQIALNPNDFDSWFNLGVLQSKDPATANDAINSFKKASEINPKSTQVWESLYSLTLGDDSKTIDDYNAAKKAGKAEVANKIIEARRTRLATALPYAEKWYENDQNNIEAVMILKGLYQSVKNDAKAQEFKAKETAMKAAGK